MVEIAVIKERTDTTFSFIDIRNLGTGEEYEMIRMSLIEVEHSPRDTIKKYVGKELGVEPSKISINEEKGLSLVD